MQTLSPLLIKTQKSRPAVPPPSGPRSPSSYSFTVLDLLNSDFLKPLTPPLGHQSSTDIIQMNTPLVALLKASRGEQVWLCPTGWPLPSVPGLHNASFPAWQECSWVMRLGETEQPSLLLPCKLTLISENGCEWQRHWSIGESWGEWDCGLQCLKVWAMKSEE